MRYNVEGSWAGRREMEAIFSKGRMGYGLLEMRVWGVVWGFVYGFSG